MSLPEQSERAVVGGRWLRLKDMWMPIAAGVVFVLLSGLGALGPRPALAGFVGARRAHIETTRQAIWPSLLRPFKRQLP